ncbi:MAG: terminase small subunit protein [Pseudomonadota bacterium]
MTTKVHKSLTYTAEIGAAICEALAEGKSLRAICRAKSMPAESTVRAWALDNVQGFAAQYARARELGYSRLAEDILRIADTPKVGTKTKKTEDGTETTTGDMIEHRRLQVDTRKWMLSKMLPKIYGDKLSLEGGGEGGALVVVVKDYTGRKKEDDAAG